MSSVFDIFNLNFSTSSLVTCSSDGSYDYFTRLIIDTLYPAVLVLLLVVVNRIHVYFRTDNDTEKTDLTNVNSQYYSVAIIFTSLILPGISGNANLLLKDTFRCYELFDVI